MNPTKWMAMGAMVAGLGTGLHAQCPNNPAEVYRLAEMYESGRFDTIIHLGHCVDSLFEMSDPHEDPSLDMLNATEKFMQLYVRTASTVGRNDLAESAMELMLERFPAFKPDPELDPPQMTALLDSLVAYPASQIGIVGGMNLNLISSSGRSALYYDLTGDEHHAANPDRRERVGYSFGVDWTKSLAFRHSLSVGAYFAHETFGQLYQDIATKDSATSGDWRMAQREKLNFIHIPLQYQFRFPMGRHDGRVYSWFSLHGGVFGRYIFHAETELGITRWFTEDGVVKSDEDELAVSRTIDRRNRMSGGVLMGVSFQMDLEEFSWFLRLYGQLGLTQMRKEGTEYNSEYIEYLWNLHLEEHNFYLHSLNLSLGIALPRGNRVKNLSKK
ncbi:MAG: hypothetical protein U0176_06890 [Bacteroidia bacterium]